jgi:hypothetical protein
MRNLSSVLVLAILALPVPALAQVYPERVTTVTRTATERVRVERYQRGDQREEQTERFTRTLKIGANGEVDLGNIAGDITIVRGGGSDATLEVIKTARGRTVEDAREMLTLVQVDITERAGRSEVRTRYPEREMRRNARRNFSVSVAYNLTAPENARVTVNTISGSISVRDIKGELSLETISGDVQVSNGGRVPKAKTVSGNVEINETTVQGPMEAATISGTLTLRKVQAQRLDLGSVSGDVVIQDVACERVHAQSISGEVQLLGALHRGARYDLGSHSGQIRVVVSGGVGFDVEASSFSGSVRSDVPLTNQTSDGSGRRGQRSLRGTFGDGSATLDLTTFSGSIVIAKQ